MTDIEQHLRMIKNLDNTNYLGFGEFIYPGGEEFIARYKFFQAIINISPEVFEELANFTEGYISLLPIMRDLSEDKKNFWFLWQDISEISKLNPECRNFVDRLIKWAEAWNLNEEWLISSALLTIISWNYDTELKKQMIVHPGGGLPKYFSRLGHELEKVKQDPEYPAPPVYIPAINYPEQYDEMVKEYKKNVKRIYKKHGWQKSPLKRINNKDVENGRDFEWVVKYQILKHDYQTIADDYFDTYNLHSNDNNVMKAIIRTAKSIGLTLRKPYEK
jgi:hypothetical protein